MTAQFNWKVSSLECIPITDQYTNVVYKVYWTCDASQEISGIPYNASVDRVTELKSRVISNASEARNNPTQLQSPKTNNPTKGNSSNLPPFIPFDQLTSAQVLDWVWSTKVDPAYPQTIKQATEAELQHMLERQSTPFSVPTALPWNA